MWEGCAVNDTVSRILLQQRPACPVAGCMRRRRNCSCIVHSIVHGVPHGDSVKARLANGGAARVATFFCVLFSSFFCSCVAHSVPHGDIVRARMANGPRVLQVMPMLLQIPRILPPLHSSCMLGYGDVVVPGLLLALLRRYDVATGLPLRRSYFLPAIVAYAVGLLLTFLALQYEIFGSNGQPALLYLVPCTLGTTLALAALRREFSVLWAGADDCVKDHDSGTDEAVDHRTFDEGGGCSSASWPGAVVDIEAQALLKGGTEGAAPGAGRH